MVVIDSNILVFAANRELEEHGACFEYVQRRRRDPAAWFLTWPIIYEFARVSTHRRVQRRRFTVQQSWAFIQALMESSGLRILQHTARHAEVLTRTLEELPELRGSILHDAHTAVLMREHGIRRIATHDTDFHRFPFVEVIDPVR